MKQQMYLTDCYFYYTFLRFFNSILSLTYQIDVIATLLSKQKSYFCNVM